MEIIDNTQKNENEKVKKTPKELTFFILKIVGNVVFYVVIVMLFLFSLMNINAGSRKEGFPNIFGRGFSAVLTDSMSGEITEYEIDSFNSGDLVTVKIFKDKDCSNLEIGDVITFYDPWIESNNPNAGTYLNTHRIVYISPDNKSVITMGDKVAMTSKFDINNSEAMFELENEHDIQTVTADNIKGIVTGVNKGAGKTLVTIQDNWLWFFVIPVLVFLLIEIFLVVKNIMELRGAKQKAELANDKDAMMAELEAQKEAMRQQILAELASQQAQAATEVANEPVEVVEKATEEETIEEENKSE